jgi:RNA polymerase sigma factor (sigma-70 family)
MGDDAMAKFNPDFWEITISAESWRGFSTQDRIWHEDADDLAARHERLERVRALLPQLEALADQVLTPRQREILKLHYFAQLNQRQIAQKLGITQQAVSEHLYGKLRNGKTVGGAIRKLRKACDRHGIQFVMEA